MRKICPNKYCPIDDTKQIKTKFLWLPKKINQECRWLEKSTWLEESKRMWDVTYGHEWIEWIGIKWLD